MFLECNVKHFVLWLTLLLPFPLGRRRMCVLFCLLPWLPERCPLHPGALGGGISEKALGRRGCIEPACTCLSRVKPPRDKKGNKMLVKSVFSPDHAMDLCLSSPGFISEPQNFPFEGCASESSGHQPLWISFRSVPIVPGCVRAFIFGSCPLKVWAHPESSQPSGFRRTGPFPPHKSPNNTVPHDPNVASPLWSCTISGFWISVHLVLPIFRYFEICFPHL